jgi:hypothetical protein
MFAPRGLKTILGDSIMKGNSRALFATPKTRRKNSDRKKTKPTNNDLSTTLLLGPAKSAGSSALELFGRAKFQKALRSWYRDGLLEGDLADRYAVIGLMRIESIFIQIDAAFGHHPLMESIPPEAPENQNRINAYMNYIARAGELLQSAVALVKSIEPPSI